MICTKWPMLKQFANEQRETLYPVRKLVRFHRARQNLPTSALDDSPGSGVFKSVQPSLLAVKLVPRRININEVYKREGKRGRLARYQAVRKVSDRLGSGQEVVTKGTLLRALLLLRIVHQRSVR